MLTIEIFFFLLFLSFVDSQRYYAFVETLFVIDQNYFPPLSFISYEQYIQTMVDTTNIVITNVSNQLLDSIILFIDTNQLFDIRFPIMINTIPLYYFHINHGKAHIVLKVTRWSKVFVILNIVSFDYFKNCKQYSEKK